MLFAISLAEKLGGRGLKAFSLHPGVIMDTGLANHLDLANMEGDAKDLRKSLLLIPKESQTVSNRMQSTRIALRETLKAGD